MILLNRSCASENHANPCSNILLVFRNAVTEALKSRQNVHSGRPNAIAAAERESNTHV